MFPVDGFLAFIGDGFVTFLGDGFLAPPPLGETLLETELVPLFPGMQLVRGLYLLAAGAGYYRFFATNLKLFGFCRNVTGAFTALETNAFLEVDD